jgi:2'-5' RNA ligase
MRLFVAIDSGRAAAAAADLIDQLRRRATRLAPRARLTWIPSERLHLTIRFIGNADASRADEIVRVLAAPLAVGPFDLGLGGLGAFPRSGRPQVLWVGVMSGEAGVQAVEREVSVRLASVGVPEEGRGYRPHLTLARVRDAAGLRASALFAGLESSSLGTSRCDAITLYESRLSPQGPTYLPLVRTRLGSGA